MELHRSECPNCGSGLDLSPGLYKGVIACHTCGSVLDASSDGLDILAKVASGEFTPVFPMSVGRDWPWRDKTFRVSGRLRYRYAEGFWDEWFCIAPDGTSLWLEDDEGVVRVLEPLTPTDAPTRQELEDDSRSHLVVNGQEWKVKERGVAAIEWFEGQLPWRVKPGTEVRYLELKEGSSQLSIEWTRRELEYYLSYPAFPDTQQARSRGGLLAAIGTPFAIIAGLIFFVFAFFCVCCFVTPARSPSGANPGYSSGSDKDAGRGARTGSGSRSNRRTWGGGRGGGRGGYGYGK